ncbi:hypothetical protein MT325_m027L [Paramecium bursaria chlorella virus MT325]|uniref:Uncharacterized protein m027L n=1 Tax=Paramecium bursaria Chlorella virus MT325 TaxID=346932 RepID=A7ITA7_PBCVM|nr:hypothetical protein MT325_m027L [Paramecium bursaria chlorella virus MT325]
MQSSSTRRAAVSSTPTTLLRHWRMELSLARQSMFMTTKRVCSSPTALTSQWKSGWRTGTRTWQGWSTSPMSSCLPTLPS